MERLDTSDNWEYEYVITHPPILLQMLLNINRGFNEPESGRLEDPRSKKNKSIYN